MKREVEYYYPVNAKNEVECHVHVVGKVFTYFAMGIDGTPEFWSTNAGGMFPKSIEFGDN